VAVRVKQAHCLQNIVQHLAVNKKDGNWGQIPINRLKPPLLVWSHQAPPVKRRGFLTPAICRRRHPQRHSSGHQAHHGRSLGLLTTTGAGWTSEPHARRKSTRVRRWLRSLISGSAANMPACVSSFLTPINPSIDANPPAWIRSRLRRWWMCWMTQHLKNSNIQRQSQRGRSSYTNGRIAGIRNSRIAGICRSCALAAIGCLVSACPAFGDGHWVQMPRNGVQPLLSAWIQSAPPVKQRGFFAPVGVARQGWVQKSLRHSFISFLSL